MSNSTIKSLKRIVENPYLNVAVGIIFLYSGISETVEEFRHSENVKFSAHHGVILFSILHILKTVPEFFEGLEYIGRGSESDR